MRSDAQQASRSEFQSDAELLRAIRRDLRVVYDEVLKKPVPVEIKALLYRLEAGERDNRERVGGSVFA
jgi:hypothetical protein